MKILITGANGLLGTAITEWLAKNHEIFALVRTLPPFRLDSVHYLQHDLSLPVEKLAERIDTLDAIVHTAQSKRYRDFPNSAHDIFDINVKSTLNLLTLGKQLNIKHFLFTSTGTVYEPYHTQLTEDNIVDPKGFYGVTKFLSEKILSCYQSELRISIFRLFFLYGPSPNISLVSSLIDKVRQGEPITLEGEEGLTLTPTHVIDIARTIEKALTSQWEGIVNVASPESITLKQLVLKICQKLNQDPVWNFLPDKQPACIIPSLAKLKSLYQEMDFLSLDKGLDHLIRVSV